MDLYNDGVSIGEVARRTGIGVSTLRAWERRYGFPVPDRRASGHRRYSTRTVSALAAVPRARRAGATLEAALSVARLRATAPTESIFAAVRHELDGVEPAALSRRAMLAVSRAIEDVASACTEPPALLVGAFQHVRFWAPTRLRWRRLAARADLVVVLAELRRSRRVANLWEVATAPDAAIALEWVVLCDAPSFRACLAGIERSPHDPADASNRVFDALWTVEPLAVRAAARAALAIAAHHSPELADTAPRHTDAPAMSSVDSARAATALTNRVLEYCDTLTR